MAQDFAWRTLERLPNPLCGALCNLMVGGHTYCTMYGSAVILGQKQEKKCAAGAPKVKIQGRTVGAPEARPMVARRRRVPGKGLRVVFPAHPRLKI